MQSQTNHHGWECRRAGLGAIAAMTCLALAVILAPRDAHAQLGPQSVANPRAASATADAMAYWTPERMRNAIPKDLGAVAPTGTAASSTLERQSPPGRPGYAPGFPPGPGPKPDPTVGYEIMEEQARALGAQPQDTPPFSSPPATFDDLINYAPFSRWTWFGNYDTFPISTIGKLFFTQGGSGFVCSASVIANNTIATAGHCVSDGAGNFSSNFLFCPGYNPTGCRRGSWGWTFATTSFQWHFSSAFDRDFACIVTAPTGSMFASPVGAITGATGRAWNWPTRQPITEFGYPQGAPFLGNRIMAVHSTEWYEVNMTLGDGNVSKYIGSDMTGGSSGGPWWISLRHPNASFEIADTDGSNLTDPVQGGGPFINGINSHKRCGPAGCVASLFSQEMGSPQFTSDGGGGDINESEDIFLGCFSNGGT